MSLSLCILKNTRAHSFNRGPASTLPQMPFATGRDYASRMLRCYRNPPVCQRQKPLKRNNPMAWQTGTLRRYLLKASKIAFVTTKNISHLCSHIFIRKLSPLMSCRGICSTAATGHMCELHVMITISFNRQTGCHGTFFKPAM